NATSLHGVRNLGDELRLPAIGDVGDRDGGAALAALARLPEWRRAVDGAIGTARFAVGHVQFLGVLRPLRLSGYADGIVVETIPQTDFLGPVERALTRNIAISAILTLLLIGLGVLVARAVGLSLRRVVSETEALQRFEFEGDMPRSRFREIDQIFRTY